MFLATIAIAAQCTGALCHATPKIPLKQQEHMFCPSSDQRRGMNRWRSQDGLPPLALACTSGKPAYQVEVVEQGDDPVFGVQMQIRPLEGDKKTIIFSTDAGQKLPFIGPGRYQLLSEASRRGFPQEVRYDVLDGLTGRVVENFARSHVAVTNVLIKPGERLRVTLLPSTRPYNAVFYHITSRRIMVAHVFTRPYPAQDFDVGEFNGLEQFNSAPLGMAFWGEKMVREYPAEAERIRTQGVSIGRSEDLVKDPVLVLGVRTVARDLAKIFVANRATDSEDYRGAFHVTFLVRRDAQGKVPSVLKRLSLEELASTFEREILWMMIHNVHRPQEGGGYAGKTFQDDFEEARGQIHKWLAVTQQSTDEHRAFVYDVELLVTQRGLDGVGTTDPDVSPQPLKSQLIAELTNFLKAAARERKNYATYSSEDLKAFFQEMGQPMQKRLDDLSVWIPNALSRLAQVSPGAEKEFTSVFPEAGK